MMNDLGLTATQFGLATTMFYIAYIACGIPSNIVLARLGARIWIGTLMILWGLASTATMFATTPGTLYGLRVLVGITEAGFLPGMLLYLTYWFPEAYRARANALFMIAMPLTSALASAVSGYILGLDGALGLRGWQWLFLLEGLPSVLLGIAVYFYLDDKPAEAAWLNADEKAYLDRALRSEHDADPVPTAAVAKKSLLAELISPTVVKFGLAYFCLVNTLATVAVWAPLIVKSFSAGASNIYYRLAGRDPAGLHHHHDAALGTPFRPHAGAQMASDRADARLGRSAGSRPSTRPIRSCNCSEFASLRPVRTPRCRSSGPRQTMPSASRPAPLASQSLTRPATSAPRSIR